MSEFVTGIVQTQVEMQGAGAEKQAVQQTQKGRSFESVLQKEGSQTTSDSDKTVSQLSDPKLEAGRQDLMERYQNLPEGVPKVSSIFPEYLDTKTKITDFRSYLNKAKESIGGIPNGSSIQGTFSGVESEWKNLTSIMESKKDLSQGELLALQAGLYQVSQHIEVLSKVVDQMTNGVKTVLNTNI